MIAALNFLWGFFFSFIGSIPPGTINLTCVQLGLEKKIKIAWRFAIAASVMEYPYAWIAVEFAEWITSSRCGKYATHHSHCDDGDRNFNFMVID
jgi:threonine/homoserine/homoserine lactone efflux protein